MEVSMVAITQHLLKILLIKDGMSLMILMYPEWIHQKLLPKLDMSCSIDVGKIDYLILDILKQRLG